VNREEFVRFAGRGERLERLLRAAAAITAELAPHGLKPVVVGGSAVEFYTSGAYTTLDVDMVVEGLQEIDAALRGLGFRRLAGTSYVHPQVDIVIDLPAEPLAGDPRRISSVSVDGLVAYVIGLEDIIADRLRAFVYWEDRASEEWAVQLMAAQWEYIDWPYLATLAKAESAAFSEALGACREMAEALVRSTQGGDPADLT